MNPLASLYSWANGVKRRVSNPLETIAMGLQRGKEDMLSASDSADVAYGRGGMKSVLVSPEQRSEAARAAADFGANMGMGAATVWHGSPHKFDKFDSSKIGTGEGAQAYGHGMYLADSQAVAQGYKSSTSRPEFIVGGERWAMDQGGVVRSPTGKTTATLPIDQYNAIFGLTGSKSNRPLAELAEEAESFLQTRSGMTPAKISAAKQAILDGRVKLNAETGSLYKVDLPDEHIAKMLDWDKPLSQQPPGVLELIAKRGPVDDPRTWGWNNPNTVKGQDAYNILARGSKATPGSGDVATAQMLRQAGIPGVRYLDGGSRGAGAGSSNYVVFPGNESLLQILERNGVPIK